MERVIHVTHRRVFDMGVTQYHYDIMVHHFAMLLSARGFEPSIVTQALAILKSLRSMYPKSQSATS